MTVASFSSTLLAESDALAGAAADVRMSSTSMIRTANRIHHFRVEMLTDAQYVTPLAAFESFCEAYGFSGSYLDGATVIGLVSMLGAGHFDGRA